MAEATQTKTTIAIDPVTRIEGHLKAEVVVENGKVVDAKLTGGMYRGFESILRGLHPRDAAQIVQRICGVCPTAHATAASIALEKASGTAVPSNGRATRNLILGANYLQSHILHFYHLAGQDFIQGPDTAPFMPRYAKPDLRLPPAINAVGVDQYVEALEVRAVCHEMVALFGGRMPHVHGILAGGAAEIPTKEKLVGPRARFKKVLQFVEEKYSRGVFVGSQYSDLGVLGRAAATLCAWACSRWTTRARNSCSRPGSSGRQGHALRREAGDRGRQVLVVRRLHLQASPLPRARMSRSGQEGAYSFVKAPLYNRKPMEVGPLARCGEQAHFARIGPAVQGFGLDVKNFPRHGREPAFSLLGVVSAPRILPHTGRRSALRQIASRQTFSMPVMEIQRVRRFTGRAVR